jgi:hypothetical protein
MSMVFPPSDNLGIDITILFPKIFLVNPGGQRNFAIMIDCGMICVFVGFEGLVSAKPIKTNKKCWVLFDYT